LTNKRFALELDHPRAESVKKGDEMVVKVITDSSADLPPQLIEELGITVVPLYVRFGEEVYRDRITINEDEFYKKLEQPKIYPVTSQPGPQDFLEVYQKVAAGADGIISVHISSKLSGTCNSAVMAKDMVENGCPIEIVDTLSVTGGVGLFTLLAARMAKAGENLENIAGEVKAAVPKTHLFALFDTLKYLLLGGRIGKAKALLGSILNIKPLLSLKEGEVVPVGQIRTRAKGIDKLVEFCQGYADIQDMAVVHATTPDEAVALADRLSPLFDRKRMVMGRLGPALGAHMGPGALIVSFREK
jgi:DegV family protein with EDD domain